MKILDVPQSGSVAGTTSSRNRFGQYRRSRATPVNPNSIAQQDARNRLSAFAVDWRALTDPQRAAWEAYSAEHPVTDSLGQSNVLTGFQQYVGVSSLLTAALLPPSANPPTEDPPAPYVWTVDDATAAALSITADTGTVPTDTSVVVDSSPPLSAGRNFNADFRRVTVFEEADTTEVTAAMLTAKWGTLAPGMKFFVRFRVVTPTGAGGAFVTVQVVLT